MYQVIVPGEPKAKARPRWAKFGMYSPKKTVEYENLIRLFFTEQNPGAKLIEGAVSMVIMAYFAIPKSTAKKTREAMLAGKIRPTKRPDTDNIIKVFSDSLSDGIAYKDDSQICSVKCEKVYSPASRVICQIEAIGKEEK